MSHDALSTHFLSQKINPPEINFADRVYGRRFLILNGGSESNLPLYYRIQEFGIKMVVLDDSDHWTRAYVESGLFESYIETNSQNLDDVLSLVEAYGTAFDGVITFQESSTHLAVSLARSLGCFYISEASINAEDAVFASTAGENPQTTMIEIKDANNTSYDARLIGDNPPLEGGLAHQRNRLVWGGDQLAQHLYLDLRQRIQPIRQRVKIYLSSYVWMAPYTGTVLRDNFLDHLKNDPYVVFHQICVKAGQRVNGSEHSVPGCLGEFIVQGESREEADQRLEEIIAALPLPLQFMSTSVKFPILSRIQTRLLRF